MRRLSEKSPPPGLVEVLPLVSNLWKNPKYREETLEGDNAGIIMSTQDFEKLQLHSENLSETFLAFMWRVKKSE